ncbi:MAG TPA: hypothetical protein VHY91_24055 [Pirellulales bacterium]|nr:hypothetical protein [Pirellulales bacterium]
MNFATDRTARRCQIWAFLALACLTLAAGPARAVDDVVVADVVAAQGAPNGRNVGVFMNNNQNNLSVVDQWLFQRSQGDQKRMSWNATLARQLAELKQCGNLSDVQAQKMALAMQCDVEQFFSTVEQMRDRFPKADQGNNQEVQREMFPLQLKSQSGALCGPDSFYEKMLPRVLDAEQLAKYQAIVEQRRRERYRTAVDLGLLEIEDRLALNSHQHDALRQLLIELPMPHTVPTGWYMSTLIMYRLSQVPESQLKPLFDEKHWQAFNQDRMRYQGYRDYLRQMGALSD